MPACHICTARKKSYSVSYVALGGLHELAAAGSPGWLVLVAWETNAAALNPFIISHPPTNTSHNPPGSSETRPRPDPMSSAIIPQQMIAYPTRPQTAIPRSPLNFLSCLQLLSLPERRSYAPSLLFELSPSMGWKITIGNARLVHA